MKLKKLFVIAGLSVCVVLYGCGGNRTADGSGETADSSGEETADSGEETAENNGETEQMKTQLEQVNMTQWQYNEEADVYWQTGIAYCENPADETYETLGIYVPGAYMDGTDNGDGTYTCEINTSGTVGGYTAETAPVVLPVDTPGYSAMPAPTGYENSTASYTDAGFVYVSAGCRGRDAGAPAGVTDLKAAIRYIRYNGDTVPGSKERLFSFGMSGGGAQSALIGATGNSELYDPYLEAIGAVSGVSDAVAGSMCWCPITNLDTASEAYEWNLGVTRTDLTEDMQKLSDEMAEQFALYINELNLKDENGNAFTLTASEEGIYQAGSYYEYLKDMIETSLNNFLQDTEFPYTVETGKGGNFGGGRMGLPDNMNGELPAKDGDLPDGIDGERPLKDGGLPDDMDGDLPGGMDGERPLKDGGLPDDMDGDLPDLDAGEGTGDGGANDGIVRNDTAGGLNLSGTYETVQDYIEALNEENVWVTYDSETNTAAITSIADFVSAFKLASKNLGAFDALDRSQGENILFGSGDGSGGHFDAVMADLLADSDYGTEFAEDLAQTDAAGVSVADRVDMYNPMFYLCEYYGGYQTADVASYWRIRTGINQSDTALTTEANLALALENYGVDVDFETVWGQAHVEAERTGNSTDNFIAWVTECCQ